MRKFQKQLISTIMAVIMILTTVPITAVAATNAGDFSDVNSDDFYYEAVLWAVKNKVTSGTTSTAFSPQKDCTRGQIVTFLYKAGDGKPVAKAKSFDDVKKDKYYYNPVSWAVSKEITSGTSEKEFSPNDSCTRAQAVTFLWKFAGSPKASKSEFDDVKDGKFYYNAVNWAVENGITAGTGEKKFSPNRTCTRGQIVTFLYKFFEVGTKDNNSNTEKKDNSSGNHSSSSGSATSTGGSSTEQKNKYTVTFETSGGNLISSQQLSSGEKVSIPEDPVREGYHFVAWYKDENLTELYDFNTEVLSNITLYAKWEKISEETVSFIDEKNPDIEIYSFNTDTWDIVTGQSATVTLTAEVFAENALDDNAVVVVDDEEHSIGYMNDKGENGDVKAGDGIYTLQTSLSSQTDKTIAYSAEAEGVKSESVTISYYTPHTEEDYNKDDDVNNQLNQATASYFDENGYWLEGEYDNAKNALIQKLNELKNDVVEDYSISERNVKVILKNGTSFLYIFPLDDGMDSGSGNIYISTYQPFKGTYSFSSGINGKSDRATDGSAEKIAGNGGYQFTGNFDLENVSLEQLRHLSDYSIILWHGHGGYNKRNGSHLMTGQAVTSSASRTYDSDISAGRIENTYYAAGKHNYAITGGFIQKYVGRMNNAFVYLAACDSGMDMINGVDDEGYHLVQSFINKGATSVIANNETICSKYNTSMEADTIDAMCKLNSNTGHLYTVHEALKEAFDHNGPYCCEKYKASPCIFPQSNSAASNYRLENGYIAGSVKDAASSATITDALIRVYTIDGNLVTSGRTNANGSYNINVGTGNYILKVSAGSYKSVKMAVTVNKDSTTYNETFLLMSNRISLGRADGVITNSVTEARVNGVTLNFRRGWNNRTGKILYSSSTNENGAYEVTSDNLLIGFYTMEMVKSGFVTGYKNIAVRQLDMDAQNAVLSPISSDNTYRAVLTWGENPRDLDSHVEGKLKDNSSFHVYYAYKSQNDGDSEVCNLDVDDTTSYGPETTTLIPNTSEPYYYYIYKYAGSGAVSTSGAQIKLYKGSDLIKTYNVPTNQGTSDYWNVFAIKDGKVITKDTISDTADLEYAS